MIDYFTHFIYIQFHLFRRNDAAAVNHRADFADKRTDFLRIHSRLLRNPAERAFIVRHFLYIHLNLSSQFFRKVDKLLMDQVCMIFLLIIQSPYQFGKLEDLFSGSRITGITRCRLRAVNIINSSMAIIVRYNAQRSGCRERR